MRVYLALFISGDDKGKRVKITLPHYYRDNQLVWIGKYRARILELIK